MPCTPSHRRPLITDTLQSTLDTYLEDTDINSINNNTNNNNLALNNSTDINSGNNNVNNNNLVLDNSAVNNGNNNNNNNIVISSNNIIDDPNFRSNTPQAPDSSDTNSDTINPALVKFSTSDKASKADTEIKRIRQYLLSRHAPSDLPANALTRFISRAHCYLIMGGRLWQRQHTGRHQLYAHPSIRYALVRNTHNQLGHKGFYSMRCTLLNHFWWPALETDMKWYVQTCHQCQIWQTTKIQLLPIVNTPVPLFRKVYIDTMFMLHAGGYRYITQAWCSLTAWPKWRALHVKTGQTIRAFIFEEILC